MQAIDQKMKVIYKIQVIEQQMQVIDQQNGSYRRQKCQRKTQVIGENSKPLTKIASHQSSLARKMKNFD